MLLQENRLKKRKDFEKVLKEGKGFKQDFLFLKIIKNNLENTRFAIIVSQKVSKKAVIRNQLKRRLREILRKKIPTIKKGLDGIFIAQPGLEKRSFQELEETITILLKKANLLYENF